MVSRCTVRLLLVAGLALLPGCPPGETTTTTTTTTTSTTSTTVRDAVPPPVPGMPAASAASCTQVSLAWTAVVDAGGSGLRGYNVRRSGAYLKQVLAPGTATTDTVTGPVILQYTLSAVDNAGNESAPSAAATVMVPACANQPPVASAGPDVFTQTLTAVAFNGAGSSDPDGTITAATWTFGDGTSGSGLSASHAYAVAGTYTATLTVTDNGGRTASDTAVVSVTNRAPTANAGADVSGAPGTPLAFSGAASADADGTVAAYAWSFGDGGSGSGVSASHAYAAAGTYTVTLTVTDDRGAQGTDTAVVTIASRWSRGFGGAGDDRVYAVAADAGGNVAVTGYFSGTVDLGPGPMTSAHFDWLDPNAYKDAVVARYAADGTALWSRQIGAESDDRGNGVAVEANGDVVVTGAVQNYVDLGDGVLTGTGGANDVFVARYRAADGAHVWSHRFGGSGSDAGTAVAVDASGNVLVVGSFQGTVDFGGGPLTAAGGSSDQDVFVAKYSPAGAHLWSRRFGNASTFDYVWSVAVDAAGDLGVTGSFYGTLGLGGASLVSAGGYDVWAAKLRGATGDHVWSKRFGGTADDTGYGAAWAPNGDLVLAGLFRDSASFGGATLTSAGAQDVFVAALTSAGAHRWSRRAGASGDDEARAVAVDPNGSVLVTGWFQGAVDFGGGALTASGGGDLFVARYATASGAYVASQRYGGLGWQYGASVAVQPSGNAVVGGYFQTAVDFGGGALANGGGYDGCVASLVP